jgi:hypothetical protein
MGASSAGGGTSGRREEKTASTKRKLYLKAGFPFPLPEQPPITPGFACAQHYELRSKIVATSHRCVRSQPTTDGAGPAPEARLNYRAKRRPRIGAGGADQNRGDPLDGYPFCASPDDGREIVFGIRPEHVSLANQETRGPVIKAETLFIEPIGADTLGWFQYRSQRISARLRPQRAREISGKVRLAPDIG